MRENERINLKYKLLTMREVSEITRCGVSTLYRLVAEREFPPPIKIGKGKGGNRWRSDDLEKWLEQKFKESRMVA